MANVDLTIKMGTAQLGTALDQHVDARTTGLGCATTKNTRNKTKKSDWQPQTNRYTKLKKFAPVQYAHKNLLNSISIQDHVADEFEKMSFYSMEKSALGQRHLPHWTLFYQTGNVSTN